MILLIEEKVFIRAHDLISYPKLIMNQSKNIDFQLTSIPTLTNE